MSIQKMNKSTYIYKMRDRLIKNLKPLHIIIIHQRWECIYLTLGRKRYP